MAITVMGTANNGATNPARIGRYKGRILAHAIPREVLRIAGKHESLPKGSSDTLIMRRYVPLGTDSSAPNTWNLDPNNYQVQEGVTPNAQTLNVQDITVTLQEYAVLFSYSNRVADMYEDNVPPEFTKMTGNVIAYLREQTAYGVLKGGTNRFYAGGTSRDTVDSKITINSLRRVTRSLENNEAQRVTEVLAASEKYNTSPVSDGFLVFCSTDLSADIRDLPNFIPKEKYGPGTPKLSQYELGACEEYRFIVSPHLKPYLNAGAAVGTTDLLSTGGSNIDVYPVIICGEDAWSDVMLRGAQSMKLIDIPPGKEDKADPLGQRGYIGGRYYDAVVITNNGWMAILEVGATDLDED